MLYLDNKPQYLITDDDASYVDGELRKFNTKELISQWVIAPYTHNANPTENIMRRIMEGAIMLLHDSGLPPSFLLYALQHFVEATNRTY